MNSPEVWGGPEIASQEDLHNLFAAIVRQAGEYGTYAPPNYGVVHDDNLADPMAPGIFLEVALDGRLLNAAIPHAVLHWEVTNDDGGELLYRYCSAHQALDPESGEIVDMPASVQLIIEKNSTAMSEAELILIEAFEEEEGPYYLVSRERADVRLDMPDDWENEQTELTKDECEELEQIVNYTWQTVKLTEDTRLQ